MPRKFRKLLIIGAIGVGGLVLCSRTGIIPVVDTYRTFRVPPRIAAYVKGSGDPPVRLLEAQRITSHSVAKLFPDVEFFFVKYLLEYPPESEVSRPGPLERVLALTPEGVIEDLSFRSLDKPDSFFRLLHRSKVKVFSESDARVATDAYCYLVNLRCPSGPTWKSGPNTYRLANEATFQVIGADGERSRVVLNHTYYEVTVEPSGHEVIDGRLKSGRETVQ